jgi:hypothetical protein
MSDLERLRQTPCSYDCTCELPEEPCALIWAAAEIERLTRERDEWKEKWRALAQAALIIGRGTDQGIGALDAATEPEEK